MMHIVLVEPEIPQNTGNIARTCAATGAMLHLIKPLGFSLEDKYLKRAGLDYWKLMQYRVYENWQEFLQANPGAEMRFFSTRAPRDYAQTRYADNMYLVFGKETKGLDEGLLAREYERCVRIPMRAEARSLNLSNSVAIALFEALRQQDFPGLQAEGRLSQADEGPEWKDYI